MWLFIILHGLLLPNALALDNGLALTPPMGWLSWQVFGCKTECKDSFDGCISEALMKRIADVMVSDGYLEAGYNYVTVDDCWMERSRGPNGELVPDRRRFPNGMKAVADYVHGKGLKFGIYEDMGNLTCQEYPGIAYNEKLDIDTMIGWGADYLKLDGCNYDDKSRPMFNAYADVSKLLNETGRPVVYSCSLPAYISDTNYTALAKICNLWRNYGDIDNTWQSVKAIMDEYGKEDRVYPSVAGPGQWNDPDMLIVGIDGALNEDQSRVQMAVWAVLAAPLLMSADLKIVKPEFKKILLNKDIIAIDQDPLGKQGLKIKDATPDNQLVIWKRILSNDAFAIAFVNYHETAIQTYEVKFEDLKLSSKSYKAKDLYHEEPEFELKPNGKITLKINPTGVKFYKLSPVTSEQEITKDEEESIGVINDNNV